MEEDVIVTSVKRKKNVFKAFIDVKNYETVEHNFTTKVSPSNSGRKKSSRSSRRSRCKFGCARTQREAFSTSVTLLRFDV